MAKGQKGISVVMCVERVIGNLMDSANGFHAPKPDLDVKQENNNPRNNKVFDKFFMGFKPRRIHFCPNPRTDFERKTRSENVRV